MAKDPIAPPSFFTGSFTRTRGMGVNLKSFPGTPVQNPISNSTCVLLILVNSVENCRKIRKCKPNFVGLMVKSATTFVILA
jgi:hypothetical protein